MTLLTNTVQVVNGLPIYCHDPRPQDAPFLTPPTVRQLDLLEQAINACSYDWDRLRKIGLGVTSVQFWWVNDAYLYDYGVIGTTPIEDSDAVPIPGGSMQPAFAPVTRPNGNYGDYGGTVMANGVTSLYLLNTLDQAPQPHGGIRFYMETVVRLLGLATTYLCLRRNASQRDRLARCFIPIDRPDFDREVDTPDRWFWVPEGTPGAGPVYDPQIPNLVIGYVTTSESEVDVRMYATSAWFFESSGVEYRMALAPPGKVPLWGAGGAPGGPYADRWGWGASPVPAPSAWEARLFEAAAETFKDVFTTKPYRRLTNRTAVKLKSGRRAWDTFVGLYMDEIPGPPDASGIYTTGPTASGDFIKGATICNHVFTEYISGAQMRERFAFYEVPDLGDASTPVTIELTGGHAGQYGVNWAWHFDVEWSGVDGGARPPSFHKQTATMGEMLPLRIQIPKGDFADTQLAITLGGADSGLKHRGCPNPGVPLSELAEAVQRSSQDPLFGTENGQSGTFTVPAYQWFKYRVTLPTGAHPKYPAGELHIEGADTGTRRNARQRVGQDEAIEVALIKPPPGPPAPASAPAAPFSGYAHAHVHFGRVGYPIASPLAVSAAAVAPQAIRSGNVLFTRLGYGDRGVPSKV